MTTPPLVTALVYSDSDLADRTLRQIALALLERDWRLAGLVQHNQSRPGRSRCDMILEELGSGELIGITQDRGPMARGCALDVGQLLSAMELVRRQIERRPDLVILNKFGKTEAEGGGFRPVIAETVEAEIPLLIAIPWRNIESWRLFVGEMGTEHGLDGAEMVSPGEWLDRLGYGERAVSLIADDHVLRIEGARVS
jgi:nucleoside-triphosphatase THEP1